MKTLNSVAALGAACLLLLSAGQTQAQCTAGSTLIVGPSDQYAFQWCNGTSVTSIGLLFASSQNEYQFKKTDGSNLMTLDPTPSGYVRMGDPDNGNYAFVDNDGDLRFAGTADFLVENNAYAFRSRADEDNGLFFNVTLNQYEFRSSLANAAFTIKANTVGSDVNGSFHTDGDGDIDGSLTVGGDVEVTGTINPGSATSIGRLTASTGTFNNANTIGVLEVRNNDLFGTSSLGMDGNEIQAYFNDTATGILFLQYWGGDMNLTNGGGTTTMGGDLNVSFNDLFVDGDANEVGIGTAGPRGKLEVNSSENVEVLYLESTGSPTEMVDIERTGAAMTAGQDIINIDAPAGSSTGAQFIEASVDGTIEFQVNTNGHIGVGTSASSTYAIQACGSIRADEVIVETGWCDYVFADDYNLMDLKDVASYINSNKHLPGIPAASVIESEGMPVAEMSANFMEKIEELTLYTIEQDRQIDDLNAQIEELKSLIEGMNH